MKHLFKFTSKGSKDLFLKNIEAKKLPSELLEVSDTEIEIALADDSADKTVSTDMMENMFQSLVRYMQYNNEYMLAEIDYLNESLANHYKGHLPKIMSSEQMARALKGLGLDNEYQVAKKMVYANDNNGNLVVQLVKDEA